MLLQVSFPFIKTEFRLCSGSSWGFSLFSTRFLLGGLPDFANPAKLVIGGGFVRRFLELCYSLSRGLKVFFRNFIIDKNDVEIHIDVS